MIAASDPTFQVFLNGIRPNVPSADARANLATLFKASPEQIDKILAIPNYVVKQGVTFDVAAKYKSAIDAAGGACALIEEKIELVSLDVDLSDAILSRKTDASPVAARTADADYPVSIKQNQINDPAQQESSWHYESNGERKGPVLASDIEALFSNGSITRETLVWQEGLAAWMPITETEFKRLFSSAPPPLMGSAVKNTIVWWLAFAPLLGQFGAGLLAGITHYSMNTFWWVTLALNIGLSIADEQVLKKAGHNTAAMGSAWFVPVYLFKRAKVLKQKNAYFIVWTVLFVLGIFSAK